MLVVMVPSIASTIDPMDSTIWTTQDPGSTAGVSAEVASFVTGYLQAVESNAETLGLNATSAMFLSLLASALASRSSSESFDTNSVDQQTENDPAEQIPDGSDVDYGFETDPDIRQLAEQQDGGATEAFAAEEIHREGQGDRISKWDDGHAIGGDAPPTSLTRIQETLPTSRVNPSGTFDAIIKPEKGATGKSIQCT